MRVDVGATHVGTARIRDDARPKMTAAQKAIYDKAGNHPQVDAGFDEIADGIDVGRPAPLSAQAQAKPSKYRNQRCVHDSITFDSRRERDRWIHLCRELDSGEISDLERQVVFVLADPVVINGRKKPALRYVADFVYERNGKQVIEDVKGVITAEYRIKRHLMAARGLQIVEIK
ncbi:DUF1064 domain-containing protein [Burkholderia cepacia]|uniref:DUF1064 domain-containing protein n=3 Tax=Burkholderia cepacia TaxID=292 RepID=A0AAX2RGS5_BURCE|nr:DUF1064 domain-containing protein [Burkholderia cepacia]TEU40384.1 DUF1064 domain-containing protein [Burkholderia cepacia]TEU42444.1 DUF1064 domain-containing protein [Burkholderia cepacia]TEU57653.1 DUF1064 domain-containing protein [Burkholderia cepacia]TEU69200.1 DUF1064 domain-containing protein [Burkholderia cepacia]